MTFRFDAYCGLYCGACFIMIAYTQNRTECLPEDWIDPIDGKEIKCYGCKSELIFENCRGCRIRSCAKSKDIDFCNNCSEFPCENIKRLENTNLPHLKVAIQNLNIIKEIGTQEWLIKEKDRWLCSTCNYPFSWYEKNCVRCGTELFNSIDENKIL